MISALRHGIAHSLCVHYSGTHWFGHVAVVLSPPCGVYVHYVPLERGPEGEMS